MQQRLTLLVLFLVAALSCAAPSFAQTADDPALAEITRQLAEHREKQARTTTPGSPRVAALINKAQRAKTADDRFRYLTEACELGDAGACYEAYFATRRAEHRDLLTHSCRLNAYYCHDAGDALLSLGNFDAALDNLAHGCDAQFQTRACLRLGALYRDGLDSHWVNIDDLARDPVKADHYLQRACHLENAWRNGAQFGACNALVAFRQSQAPEALAAVQAAADRAYNSQRAVPLGAYEHCVGIESLHFGRWLDATPTASEEQVAAGYATFIRQCGGTYAPVFRDAACEQIAGRPDHHRLVCVAAERRNAFSYQHPSSGWQLSSEDLQSDFRQRDSMRDLREGAHVDQPAGPVDAPFYPVPGSLLAEVSTLGDESVFIDYMADRIVVTVNHPGHVIGQSVGEGFEASAALYFVHEDAPDPNRPNVSDYDRIPGHQLVSWDAPVREQQEHMANWNGDENKWRAQTRLVFDIGGNAALLRLLADLRLIFHVDVNGESRYFPLSHPSVQRWVAASHLFPEWGVIPAAGIADAMIEGHRRSLSATTHSCGELSPNWTGNRSETFAQADQRIAARSRMLQCRQEQLERLQSQLVPGSGNLPQTDPEYWRQTLLMRYVGAETPRLESAVAGLESFQREIAEEKREARLADQRDERRRREAEQAEAVDQREAFFARQALELAQRDHENALRVAQGYPPLPDRDSYRQSITSQSSSAASSNRRSPERGGSAGGSGSSGDDAGARRNEASRARVQDWIDRFRERCSNEDEVTPTGGRRCSGQALGVTPRDKVDYELQSPRGLVEHWEAQARQQVGKAVGQCPTERTKLADGRTLYYRPLGYAISEPLRCERFQDGEFGTGACWMVTGWACEQAFSGGAR